MFSRNNVYTNDAATNLRTTRAQFAANERNIRGANVYRYYVYNKYTTIIIVRPFTVETPFAGHECERIVVAL